MTCTFPISPLVDNVLNARRLPNEHAVDLEAGAPPYFHPHAAATRHSLGSRDGRTIHLPGHLNCFLSEPCHKWADLFYFNTLTTLWGINSAPSVNIARTCWHLTLPQMCFVPQPNLATSKFYVLRQLTDRQSSEYNRQRFPE